MSRPTIAMVEKELLAGGDPNQVLARIHRLFREPKTKMPPPNPPAAEGAEASRRTSRRAPAEDV